MIVALDVDYRDDHALAAAVAFERWTDERATCSWTALTRDIAPYVSGRFAERELPPLVAVLALAPVAPTVLIVDGYVWLAEGVAGLGEHLADVTGLPVVGVAKRARTGAPAVPVLRGASQRPLWVTSHGVADAAEHVRTMHGPHRLPTLLKLVDTLARSLGSQ